MTIETPLKSNDNSALAAAAGSVPRQPRFPVGTKFKTQHRDGRKTWYRINRVTDIWTTYNLDGQLVKTRYVATHEFCGQTVTDYDVVETTIARGLIDETA